MYPPPAKACMSTAGEAPGKDPLQKTVAYSGVKKPGKTSREKRLRFALPTTSQIASLSDSCGGSLHLFYRDFINNIYSSQEIKPGDCPDCGSDVTWELAASIFTTLRKQGSNLPFGKQLQLRAAFWSLAEYDHGVYDSTSFNIVDVIESTTEVLATVKPDGGGLQELTVSEAEIFEMVQDPLEQGDNFRRIWEELTAPVIGKFT